MLTITIPNEGLAALDGDGFPCKINGEPVGLRLIDGYLCYHGDGEDNRCKVLLREAQPDGVVRFVAASPGEENEPHAVFAVCADGQPVNLLAPLPGLPGGPELH